MASYLNSEEVDVKPIGNIVFMSDFHYNPDYNVDFIKKFRDKVRPSYKSMRTDLMSLKKKTRTSLYKLILNIHEQVNKMSEVYSNAPPQDGLSQNLINTNNDSV